MSDYQEQVYTKLFEPLMKLLSRFKELSADASEPAAYIALKNDITEDELDQYNSFVNECLDRINSIESDALNDVKNGMIVPMFYLFRAFNLNWFEKFCFMLSFACASEAGFRRMINYIYDDYSKEYPSVELCAHIIRPDLEGSLELCTSFIDGFNMQRFLYTEDAAFDVINITKAPLLISDRIYRFLYDISSDDDSLKGLTEIHLSSTPLKNMVVNTEYLSKLNNLFGTMDDPHFICIRGAKGVGKKTILVNYCKTIKANLITVDISRLEQEANTNKLSALVDRIIRESLLKGEALIAFTDYSKDRVDDRFLQQLIWTLEKKMTFFFFTTEDDYNFDSIYHPLEIFIDEPDYDDMVTLWTYYIEQTENATPEKAKEFGIRLSDQYSLTPAGINNAVDYAVMKGRSDGVNEIVYENLVDGCRRQFSHAISKDAVKIKTVYGMENLILPDAQKSRLQEACNQIRYKNLVYNSWGFSDKMAYGRGVSMIFYGPPGTGKTMGAQVMAKELGLELYRVDLSSIMSKYVGESEKKLNNIFEQGKRSQCILFFDEADSLFGKRSEVKDSQDKYANASTAFLLQKMEDYDGIIILATNFLQNFDTAFMRRFKYLIEFPFPDERERTIIWKSVFPEKAPLEDDVDFDYLGSQFKLSGSQIKSTALAALFLAAGANRGVSLQDILVSIKREMKKQGKSMLEADFGQYFYLVDGVE